MTEPAGRAPAYAAVDLIRAKRDGVALTADEVRWLMGAYLSGEVAEEQMSALLMAIYFRGLEPPEPVNRNIYHMTGEESESLGIGSLPHDLSHALDALEADDVIRAALGDHIFTEYVRLKREEWAAYNEQVHQWEIDEYMDRY